MSDVPIYFPLVFTAAFPGTPDGQCTPTLPEHMENIRSGTRNAQAMHKPVKKLRIDSQDMLVSKCHYFSMWIPHCGIKRAQ